jgi:aspartate ammonia-lyase
MPGKVNPVVLEAVIQSGLRVMADDMLIADAVSRGTWQINEFMPLIADTFLGAIDLLTASATLLAGQVRGLVADEARCRFFFDQSPMIVTALLPLIGYERATELIREYDRRKSSTDGSSSSSERQAGGTQNIRLFLEEKLGKGLIEEALSPYRLTALGYRKHGNHTQGQ